MSRTQCVLPLVALFMSLAHSWDIAISAGDRLEFYTNETKTNTVHLNSQNPTALAYDEVHNMLFYVDKQSGNDSICGYKISAMEYKCYIERNGRNIQGLAFDPITEILFFTDTKEISINWISFKPESKNNVFGNLLIKMDDGIPTDIAVDSCRGYIYWINTNLTTPTIERARFNGSERQVVIKSDKYKLLDPHSLAIGQQTQKIYWIVHETVSRSYIYSADLNGKNKKSLICFNFDSRHREITHPNTLTASKKFLYSVTWCTSCGSNVVRRYPKPTIQTLNHDPIFKIHNGLSGIAANYKISDQIQGVPDCKGLESLIPNNYMTNDSLKIARESEGPFCDHGIKVTGESLCKCNPGFIGKRCDVSVCENYCLQGDCNVYDDGLPLCRCNTGYSGARCELNVCVGYCLNNGTCSLNEVEEAVCECTEDYAGDRCDVPVCLNSLDCSRNEDGSSCKAEKNNTSPITSTSTIYYSSIKNLTLVDLFTNWNQTVATISFAVEVPKI